MEMLYKGKQVRVIFKGRRIVVSVCFLLVLLASCSRSASQPIDPAALEALLQTEPEMAISGTPVALKVDFTGADISNTAQLTFEIRVNGKGKLVEASNRGNGQFIGDFTFPIPDVYDVYLHLYTDDIHLTKKKQVEVQ